MKKKDRLNDILYSLKINGSCDLTELSQKFNVSLSTIRRDVKDLEESNQVSHLRNGEIIYKSTAHQSLFEKSSFSDIERKIRIAEHCVEKVKEKESIMLGVGEIPFLIGKILSGVSFPVRIITNSLSLVNELSSEKHMRVILLGGVISNGHTLGFDYEGDQFSDIKYVDKLFIDADGISLGAGLSYFRSVFFPILRKMVRCANETIAVTDSANMGVVCFHSLLELEEVSSVVTDKGISRDTLNELLKKGIRVETV